MTAKVATISNGRAATSAHSILPRFTDNLLRSTTKIPVKVRQHKLALWIIIIALVSAIFAIAQVFGAENAMHNDTTTNTSGSTSTSSDQQPSTNHTAGEHSTTNTSNTSGNSASNTHSTSVTVNGQSVAVPQNGSYDTSVDVPGGTVHVSGNTSQTVTGNAATNSTTTHINVTTDSGT